MDAVFFTATAGGHASFSEKQGYGDLKLNGVIEQKAHLKKQKNKKPTETPTSASDANKHFFQTGQRKLLFMFCPFVDMCMSSLAL